MRALSLSLRCQETHKKNGQESWKIGDRSFPSKQDWEEGSKKKEHGQTQGDMRGQGMSENK